MPTITTEMPPEIANLDDFESAHELVLELRGDVIPLDVTHAIGLAAAEGRAQIGATIEPPEVWMKKTIFTNTVGGVAISTETTTLRPDTDVPFIRVTTEKFTQDSPVDGELPTRWTGPNPQEVTGTDLETAINTVYGALDVLEEQEDHIQGVS